MTANLIRTLARIGEKPGTSQRDKLTSARHVLRRVCAHREAIHAERRALRRNARKLRQFEPFTRQAADTLERQAGEHRAAELELSRSVLLAYGQSLIHDREGCMAALGFDAVCDLLNVNRVEREQARAEGVADLAGLIFVHNLEDSASHRGEDWKRGPLFEACLTAFSEFVRTAPEGALPDPFAPGAPFGPKLPPELRVVGK